jgi:hypothetical protein
MEFARHQQLRIFFTSLRSTYTRKLRASVSRYLLSVTLSSCCPPNIIHLDAASDGLDDLGAFGAVTIVTAFHALEGGDELRNR